MKATIPSAQDITGSSGDLGGLGTPLSEDISCRPSTSPLTLIRQGLCGLIDFTDLVE